MLSAIVGRKQEAVPPRKGAEFGAVLFIDAPNFNVLNAVIRGTSPYCQNKFSQKARAYIRQQHVEGGSSKSKKRREGKNFQELFEQASHRSEDGWYGIPAPGIRAAMISACRAAGVVMTKAKLAVFVEADGFDADDGTPLVKILTGKPEYAEHAVRNQTGVIDLRARPMWKPGWTALVRIRFDSGLLSGDSVANLLNRAGMQVGLGEGRPDSRDSCGLGWGLFEMVKKNGQAI